MTIADRQRDQAKPLIKVEIDLSGLESLGYQMKLAAWNVDRFVALASRGNERLRHQRLLRMARKHRDRGLNLDVQVVTMADGVTRVIVRPLGRWAHA